MATFRIAKTRDYTVMSNYHLRDSSLSLKAKGLLSQMLSLPDGWDYTIAGLAAINREGKDAIRAAVNELEKAGYIQRRQTTDEGGMFSTNEYIVYEQPVSGSPLSGFPTTDNPSTENPLTDYPTQLNKDILNTNNPLNPPEGEASPKGSKRKSKGYKAQAETLPVRFEGFWKFYRKHIPADRNAGNRQKAIRAWDKLAPDDKLVQTMANALYKQVHSQAWLSGVGVPHASTWLNNHGWEDDWGPAADTKRQQGESPGRDEEWL